MLSIILIRFVKGSDNVIADTISRSQVGVMNAELRLVRRETIYRNGRYHRIFCSYEADDDTGSRVFGGWQREDL